MTPMMAMTMICTGVIPPATAPIPEDCEEVWSAGVSDRREDELRAHLGEQGDEADFEPEF